MPMTHAGAPVSIIMPAFRAETSIAAAVRSVLAQSHGTFELIVIADDETDYEAVLGRDGIVDDRIRFLSTGASGSGSSSARNTGLDRAGHAVVAILDADDRLMRDKLMRALPHLDDHGIVSTALRVESADGSFLRTVGEGPDRVLDPGSYKFVNLSMDSMLVYDRQKADPRYDPSFPCLTDIEFLLKLWESNGTLYHLGTPLHAYVKQPASVSNKPGAGEAMIATKKRLLAAFESGAYPLADEAGRAGLMRFYRLSLLAEQTYGERLEETPGLLFEDHLEPLLATNGRE